MLKMVLKTLVLASALTASSFGNLTTDKTMDYRTDKTVNRCIQIAEYSDHKWVKMTERQLRASSIYELEEFTQYKMRFGFVDFKYIRTEKINGVDVDFYRGTTDSGDAIQAMVSTDQRDVIFLDMKGLHTKKFVCVNPK